MNEKYANLCQVFTPENNVKELLDWCGYTKNLYGKKIIENSCGDGHILKEVLKRYIDDAIRNNMELTDIKKGIEEDIFGIEYDKEQYKKCLISLNKIVNSYGINFVNWKNIMHKDTLKNIEQDKYDFVVGNPPYIKYAKLDIGDREYIKENFSTCKRGKFDYCYAFIEASLKSLKTDGVMAYLIPSSIFKNVFADSLREYIKPHILKIYDYTTTKLFNKNEDGRTEDRLTSSAIMVLKKESDVEYIKYIDVTKKTEIKIKKEKLIGKWIFKDKTIIGANKRRFGDYFNASNSIATLYNKAYVISDYTEYDNYIITSDNCKIEKDILKNTISPKMFNKGKNEKIIFPYYYDKNGNLQRYSEAEFENKFKGAADYLRKCIVELSERKSDKNARWFEYGRSQALKNSNRSKILLSTVITNKVNTQILDKDNVPYSGIYIVKIKDKSLEEAEKILNSSDFLEYVKEKGINACGSSVRITAKDINEYMF